MKILILGGDGFCGWPTSLHLSALGHEVAIVDNLGCNRRAPWAHAIGAMNSRASICKRIQSQCGDHYDAAI